MSELASRKERKTVLLLGWYQASRRHVEKYQALYPNCDVITFTSHTQSLPLGLTFLWGRNIRRAVRELAQILADRPPHVVHMFSNGGAYIWSETYRKIVNTPALKNLEHIVLDSCPTNLSPTNPRIFPSSWSMLCAAFNVGFVGRWAILLLWGPMFLFWFLVGVITLQWRAKTGIRALYWSRLAESLSCAKSVLVLYSDDDKLVASSDVLAFVAFLHTTGKFASNDSPKQDKTKVRTLCFPTPSRHVAHYQLHQQLYTTTVHQFLGE